MHSHTVRQTEATPDPGGSPWLAFLVVWGTWLGMFLGGLYFVMRYGSRSLPISDEWGLLQGGSLSLDWLWAQHAEHRVPLAKLIWLGVLRLTDGDFRFGTLLTTSAWGAVSFAAIAAVRTVRGRLRWTDVFLPLALLNFGNGLNSIWWWCINQNLAPLVGLLLLLIIVVGGRQTRAVGPTAIASGLILIALCGPGGLPYVVALGPWLGYWCVMHWKSSTPHARRNSLIVAALTAVAFILLACYFMGFNPSQNWPRSPGRMAAAGASLQILSLGLGTAARPYWGALGGAILALAVAGAVCLAIIAYRRQEERVRALGLLMYIGAIAVLVVSIGRARSGMSSDYIFLGTYVPLVTPLLCCIYFIYDEYAVPRARSAVLASLVGVSLALFPSNLQMRRDDAQWRFDRSQQFETAIRSGTPTSIMAEHFMAPELAHLFREGDDVGAAVAASMAALRDAGMGQFKYMQRDPEYRAVPLPIAPTTTHRMLWKEGVGSGIAGAGDAPSITFALDSRRMVYAIRLRYRLQNVASKYAHLQASWTGGDGNASTNGAPGTERRFEQWVEGDASDPVLRRMDDKLVYVQPTAYKVLTIWINETISNFKIVPDDKPCVFSLSDVTLLEP